MVYVFLGIIMEVVILTFSLGYSKFVKRLGEYSFRVVRKVALNHDKRLKQPWNSLQNNLDHFTLVLIIVARGVQHPLKIHRHRQLPYQNLIAKPNFSSHPNIASVDNMVRLVWSRSDNLTLWPKLSKTGLWPKMAQKVKYLSLKSDILNVFSKDLALCAID